MVGGVRKKFQMTNLSIPDNFSFIKYALKAVRGVADVGDPHGAEDGSRTPPRCLEGVSKKFHMTNLTILNNFSFMKYAEK